MLARIEDQAEVAAAEVDRQGELLRVDLQASEGLARVIEILEELGLIGGVLAENEIADRRWYGRDTIGELSREEAHVIAQRVVPGFVREQGLAASETEAIATLVANTLHRCFTTHVLAPSASSGALIESCTRAVEEATTEQLGPVRAAALGRAIQADLSEH